ncbi:MAG TPA: Spy/CpxP family protein refolding chaperone [Tepidisphaeraceae bacterium]|jgi:Spy/CpxP family protein refolding chaperone|nr:Spy/CpxP family protein refolding chaperone [Tepidisphaeraceae bacterium]
MTGLKLAILLGFCLMFAAGLAVGRSTRIVAAATTRPPQADSSWLAVQLSLTPKQQQQMQDIWSAALRAAPDMPARLHDLDVARDNAMDKVLSSGQLKTFEQLETDHDAKVTQLRADHDKIMHDAQDKTRTILNAQQQAKFDALIRAHGHFSPSMRSHPATQP